MSEGAEGRHAPRSRLAPEGGRGPLGELLHGVRRERAETMTVISERCGLASGYLSYIERGKVVQPGPGQCERLAEGYQVPLSSVEAAVRKGAAIRWPTDANRLRVSRELHTQALKDAISYRKALIIKLERLGDREADVKASQEQLTRYRKALGAMDRWREDDDAHTG